MAINHDNESITFKIHPFRKYLKEHPSEEPSELCQIKESSWHECAFKDTKGMFLKTKKCHMHVNCLNVLNH